jgi:hypothetical protein
MICSAPHRVHAPGRLAGVLLVLLVLAAAAAAEDAPKPAIAAVPAGITVAEDSARWESGYGEKFFQIVGTISNGSSAAIGAVLVRTELLDAAGTVVATFDGWNSRAEALGGLSGDAARAELEKLAPGPLEPGTSDRFRATFLSDETPEFESHRIRVAAVLPPA